MINHEQGLLAKNVMIIFKNTKIYKHYFVIQLIYFFCVEINKYPKFILLWYALPFQKQIDLRMKIREN